MKFRTDFVTNSSSSSFLVFDIKNKELYDLLLQTGLKFCDTKEGHFTGGMSVVLPDGSTFDWEEQECDFLPVPSAYTSLPAWIMSMLLFEIEDVWPAKELDEYSDEAIALIKLFNEKGITHLDFDDVENWSRDALYADLAKFNDIGTATQEAEVEFGNGFEGEISCLEYVSAKNGYSLLIYFDEFADNGNEMHNKNVAVIKGDTYEDEDRLHQMLEECECMLQNEITPDTDYIVCNNVAKNKKALTAAEQWCIPVISEQGFIRRCLGENIDEDDYLDDEDDLYNELFDCTYDGGFQSMFYQYGIGTVIRTKPQN